MKLLILVNVLLGLIKILFTSLHCYVSWSAQQPKFSHFIHEILDMLEKAKDILIIISFALSVFLIFNH